MNILRVFLSRSRPHFSPSPRWMGISKESYVRSIATLIPSVSSTAKTKTCTPRNLISSGGDLLRFSSSASVSDQQDQAAWSYKGMSKEKVTDQIDFLNKTLRDMVVKIAELESDKMALLKKPDKSANDMLVLDEVKEQLKKKEEFRTKYEAEYKAELLDLQGAIGSSSTGITPKGSNTNTITHH